MNNPFVLHATHSQIRFTIEFKEAFWKRVRSGEKLSSIIKSFGLKPEVLGERRIKGIYAHLNEQVAAGVPFTDKVKYKNPESAVIRACSDKNGIKNKSQKNDRKIYNIEFIIACENFAKAFNTQKETFNFITTFIK